MLNAARLYLRYLGVSVRAQMQYRGAFLVSAFGQVFFVAAEFVGVWALFQRFGSLPGWSFAQVAFFYGYINAAYAIAEAFSTGFDRFGSLQVRTGDFDRLLLRPRSTVLQLAGYEFSLRRVGRLAVGAVLFCWASAQLALPWDLARAAVLALALVGAIAFFCGILVLQATLSFWTVESLEVMNVLTHGGVETAQYPLSLYEPWFRRFFTFVVPLGCVSYFPLLFVLGVGDPLGSPRWLQALAPMAGPLFLLIALRCFAAGIRHYTSTGS